MKLAKFYASRFEFFKACLHLHICGTELLATKRFGVTEDNTVIFLED